MRIPSIRRRWTVGSLLVLMAVGAVQAQVIQEVLPPDRLQPPVAKSSDGWGAGVQLTGQFLGWISDLGLRRRIEKEVAKLQPQVDAVMPATGGVLVVVGIQESKVPDPTGQYVRSFLDAYVATPGKTPKEAVDTFLRADRLEAGAPSGFVRRDSLLWITRRPR